MRLEEVAGMFNSGPLSSVSELAFVIEKEAPGVTGKRRARSKVDVPAGRVESGPCVYHGCRVPGIGTFGELC